MDIIGFDAQINAPRKMSNKKFNTMRPVAARTTTMRPVAARTTTMRPVAARTTTMRPVAARTTTMRPSPINTRTKFAPAQIPFTAKTKTKILATSRNSQNAPLAVVKPSGKAIPVQTLTNTTNPKTVKSVSPVQRSFMPVDLPYQTPTPKSKIVRLTNTPYSYAVNIDMIEPSVDSGSGNYYGK
jgi:hypothetical protein